MDRHRQGRLTSRSGVLDNTACSFKTRFETEKGTNPEELIAAAHAGCFAMAPAFRLQGADLTPTSLEVDAVVTLGGDGFKATKSALTLVAVVPGIGKARFDELAKGAKEGCLISKLLGAEITLDATPR